MNNLPFSPMKIVKLTESAIRAVFGSAKCQADYVNGLYRLLFPDYDAIEYVNGHPKCSKELSELVFGLAIEWDRKHAIATGKMRCGEPTFMPGGAWMNYGFSTSPAMAGFSVETCPVVMKEAHRIAA